MVKITSSAEGAHTPFEIVQRITTVPVLKPEIVAAGLVGLLKVAVPETIDQSPVPVIGVFPERVWLLAHTDWSTPALAVVGF